MTAKEKLSKEFEAAIEAVYGDVADMEEEYVEVTEADLKAIADKVAFYLGLR